MENQPLNKQSAKQDIIAALKSSKFPVIIAGAGIVGKILLDICRKAGIKIECFCDNSTKAANTEFCGLNVVYTPELKSKYKDAAVLISAAAIKDVADLLKRIGIKNWYAGGILLKDLDISQTQADAQLDYEKYAIENCILCHDGYLNPGKLFMRSIDIIITERCSLKCKECSNLMQYYQIPQNCDINLLFKSIDNFCKVVDEVMDFRVLGGEPFMNPQWPKIVQRLVKEPKAKRIVIFTNGTILPSAEGIAALKNLKVRMIISNYGPLSKNLAALQKICRDNKIIHYIFNVSDWLSCSAIKAHNRSEEKQKEIFRLCCAKNMATLSDGKLFRCPYSANAFRLSAVPDSSQDYVDLFAEPLDDKNISITKTKVKDYLLNKEYLEICDFCKGRPLAGEEVPPAVQISKPLDYHKYANRQEK